MGVLPAMCIVVGCRNCSAKWSGHRYICSKHWPAVPKTMRRRYRLVCRKLKAEAHPTHRQLLSRLAAMMGARIERTAQVRAVGIG